MVTFGNVCATLRDLGTAVIVIYHRENPNFPMIEQTFQELCEQIARDNNITPEELDNLPGSTKLSDEATALYTKYNNIKQAILAGCPKD